MGQTPMEGWLTEKNILTIMKLWGVLLKPLTKSKFSLKFLETLVFPCLNSSWAISEWLKCCSLLHLRSLLLYLHVPIRIMFYPISTISNTEWLLLLKYKSPKYGHAFQLFLNILKTVFHLCSKQALPVFHLPCGWLCFLTTARTKKYE